jgi:hypothetical protein
LVDRIRTKLQKSRLLGMQFQVELAHSFRRFCPAAPHDSGPMWVADPLSHDFCIHYTSPV